MKAKRFLSLFIATLLCLSSFTAFASEETTEEVLVLSAENKESVNYSDMSNWAYWNKGE